MKSSDLITNEKVELGNNRSSGKKKEEVIYEIMHMERCVATITSYGKANVFDEVFMPYDLYFDEAEEDDLDIRINNLNVFNHWCASRVLSLDRKYAKELLNSIGVAQATTDLERAKISQSYHCVSLTDVYWVRKKGEMIYFADLNLYDNPLNEAIVELSLKGKQMTVTHYELAPDLSTKGCFPKAWIRKNTGFKLLKDGAKESVKRELLASAICQCFDIRQVKYKEYIYDGELVTESDIITSKAYSIVSKMAFDIYACNHDLDTYEVCKLIDPVTYYGMNILDYLTGNTDRHVENWGFLIDNETNQYISLYPLMDFNQCFLSYDTIEGANCQTVPWKSGVGRMTQREAAIQAVKEIGLRQIKEMDMSKFGDMKKEADMFQMRLQELKKYDKKMKILIFDLDSTLAPIGKGIGEEELRLFRKLEDTGLKIVVASGKTCDYLCGFLRQVGLRNPIMIGENGAVIQMGVDLPPKEYYKLPISKESENSLKYIRDLLDKNFYDLWYQPNQVEVTPFPKEAKTLDEIEACIKKHQEEIKGIVIHRHVDCFDFVPEGMDKATGISYLLDLLNLSWDEAIAIGDGVNDYGMFKKAGFSLGVRVKEKDRVDINFGSTKEMLEYLLDRLI